MSKMVGEGGYVFISHSHKDFNIVREIRNCYEERGFNALCFYLKCLTDDDEITDLIKREIDSRSIFIFVDSKNSRASRYVKMERDYIKSIGRKVDRRIKIDGATSGRDFCKGLILSTSVFMSYAYKDSAVVDLVRKELISRDYRVYRDENSREEDLWRTDVGDDIERTALIGCVLLFQSVNSVKSPFMDKEIDHARFNDAFMIPIQIGDVEFKDCYYSDNIQSLRLSPEPSEKQIKRLVSRIDKMITQRFKTTFMNKF